MGSPTKVVLLDYISAGILDGLFEPALDNQVEELQVLPRALQNIARCQFLQFAIGGDLPDFIVRQSSEAAVPFQQN